MIEITGLWLNTSKDGKTQYMVGYMGQAKVLIFRNKYKDADTHPDYRLYLVEKDRSDSDDDETVNDVAF